MHRLLQLADGSIPAVLRAGLSRFCYSGVSPQRHVQGTGSRSDWLWGLVRRHVGSMDASQVSLGASGMRCMTYVTCYQSNAVWDGYPGHWGCHIQLSADLHATVTRSSFDSCECRALSLHRPLWAPMCLTSTLASTLQSSGRWAKVLRTLCLLPNAYPQQIAKEMPVCGRWSHTTPALRRELPSTAGETPTASLRLCWPPSPAHDRARRLQTRLVCALFQGLELTSNSWLSGSR